MSYVTDETIRARVCKLTPREKQVLVALADTTGTDRQIGEKLGLAYSTVKVYLAKVRYKLAAQGIDVRSRYSLISWARDHRVELGGA